MNSFNTHSRTIALVSSIVGGVVLLGVGSSAAVAAISNASSGISTGGATSLDVANISGVEVSSHASRFTLEFGDVSEATLEVEGDDAARWSMRLDDGDLVVKNKERLFDFCIGWCSRNEARVTLTLPRSLDGTNLDVDLNVDAGSLSASGNFREVDLEINAGALEFSGSASVLDASINAGRADIVADSVREADLEINAGRMDAEFTGEQPRMLDFSVSAGRFEGVLPRGSYDVRANQAAGSLDNRLETSSNSPNKIIADVSAGAALLTQ